MPVLPHSRLPQMEAPGARYDASEGYRDLVIAILRQAVQDAQGTVLAPGSVSPAQLQAEARAWLQDEAAVADLLALAGIEAALVLPRIRQRLAETAPRSPAPGVSRCRCRLCRRPQLALFGGAP